VHSRELLSKRLLPALERPKPPGLDYRDEDDLTAVCLEGVFAPVLVLETKAGKGSNVACFVRENCAQRQREKQDAQ
jgi:hypothetical protein